MGDYGETFLETRKRHYRDGRKQIIDVFETRTRDDRTAEVPHSNGVAINRNLRTQADDDAGISALLPANALNGCTERGNDNRFELF